MLKNAYNDCMLCMSYNIKKIVSVYMFSASIGTSLNVYIYTSFFLSGEEALLALYWERLWDLPPCKFKGTKLVIGTSNTWRHLPYSHSVTRESSCRKETIQATPVKLNAYKYIIHPYLYSKRFKLKQ